MSKSESLNVEEVQVDLQTPTVAQVEVSIVLAPVMLLVFTVLDGITLFQWTGLTKLLNII